jgi:hypothetical protein
MAGRVWGEKQVWLQQVDFEQDWNPAYKHGVDNSEGLLEVVQS